MPFRLPQLSVFARTFTLCVAAALAVACSHTRHDGDDDDGDAGGAVSHADAGVKKPPVDACPTSNPYCKGDAAVTVAPTCGNQPIDLAPVGVNVMIGVDGSASMAPYWSMIEDAIKQMRDDHPDVAFGIQLFWGDLATVDSGFAKNNFCGATENKVLDVGANTSQALVDVLGDAPPGPSYVGGLFQTSPVIDPLNYYLTNATKLADPTRTNYLVFITSGNDNCFGALFANNEDKLVAYQKLAIELSKLNIRVIPVGFDAANGSTGNGSFSTTPTMTNMAALNALLTNGGSGLATVPVVDDPTKLADVISQVGQTVRNCRFSIPASLDPTNAVNPFELDFTVNGAVVARDRKRVEGWNFVDGNTSQVELFGNACQAVRANATLVAGKTCSGEVCGSSAVAVETKPRAVLHVLDSSASRVSCVDGTFGCLMLPDSPFRTGEAYWEVVEHALSESLAAPINDDIEFGLQFFPSKAAASFSCDVATTPEIPPAPGTEISIMSQMLEKLPLGLSPVLQVLENIAAMPGRLADPTVQGSVVMLTDGGDNCAGVDQAELVTRFGAASAKLLAAGVKTYVVRYGAADGETPDADAQLRAIVGNGGTASSDPADMTMTPYIDAKTDADLTNALASISNTLATCSFGVGVLDDKADKDNANLYLNGEIIPFDGKAEKLQGWNWTDATQTAIEMYGDSCTSFKNNRKTSVVVEFGCAPIVVI